MFKRGKPCSPAGKKRKRRMIREVQKGKMTAELFVGEHRSFIYPEMEVRSVPAHRCPSLMMCGVCWWATRENSELFSCWAQRGNRRFPWWIVDAVVWSHKIKIEHQNLGSHPAFHPSHAWCLVPCRGSDTIIKSRAKWALYTWCYFNKSHASFASCKLYYYIYFHVTNDYPGPRQCLYVYNL